MGKKSGGKKSGKKKGGKKKKQAEPQITWKEALLAYQINLKEKALEDVRYELRALEETNARHKERNERLLEEQKHYMEMLLKQAKEFEKKLAMEDPTEKEQVIAVMMDKWECARQEERDIAELKERIARKEADIVTEQRQRTYWEEYKVAGHGEHSLQIKLLKHELVDMQTSFDDMAGHLERTLVSAKEEVDTHTTETLDKQKDLASEKAMAKLDKHSRQEVLDNDWLKRETAIHREEVANMLKEVESTENDNIDIMAQLFECTVDDLKISRNFYLTQFEDEENLERDGILEMDLSMLHISKPDDFGRARSAKLRSIEDKVMSMATPRGDQPSVTTVAMYPAEHDGDDADTDHDSDFDGENGLEDSGDEDPFNNYFQFDDDDFDDYLKLGPLELKLLSIKGEHIPIHKPDTPPQEELNAKDFKPDQWPVTQPMLKHTVDKV